MQDFQKQICSIVLGPNHSGKILIFVEVIFFDPPEIEVLGLTWSVTLQFEDLAVNNYLFLKYICIRW